MTVRDVLKELKAAGTAQNRKVYARHGVGESMYGVSYAALGSLSRKIKTDHALALKLWETGNHDARVLATMIADPEETTVAGLRAWARELDNYVLTDAFVSLVARSPHADRLGRAWRKSKGEWTGMAGWKVIAYQALAENEMPDAEFVAWLEEIEAGIGAAKNRVRSAMNNAVIAIGTRNAGLKKKAIAAARRIGPVDVDRGQTGCKTPDAEAYIEKTWARKKAKSGSA